MSCASWCGEFGLVQYISRDFKVFHCLRRDLNPGLFVATPDGQSKSLSGAVVNARSLKSIRKLCPASSGLISNLSVYQNFVYCENLEMVRRMCDMQKRG